MIHTRLNDQLLIVLNEADGPFSLQELQQASEEARRLVKDGYAIVWDFRKLSMNDVDPTLLTTIGDAMRVWDAEPTPQKRAMLVSTANDQEQLEVFIGNTSVNWPWAVFQDFGKALQWLNV